jgi:Collagen triple helix repeat (20 copies)
MKKIIILLIAAMAVIIAAGASAGSAGLITSTQIKNHTIQLVDISPNAAHALRGQRGALGLNGSQGITGVNGANGLNGPKGDKGDTGAAGAASTVPGPKGDTGATGPPGLSGIKSPLVFGPYNSGGLDSSVCGNPDGTEHDWATDTYTRTYTVTPQSNGTFQVTELFDGTFVTVAGASPNTCDVTIPAGITGTMYGDYAVVVPTASGFNFKAVCPAGCTTKQFFTAFFGKPASFIDSATYAWQFHYTADNPAQGTWDNTDHGNTGNITS